MSSKQSERFHEILDVIKKLHDAKRHDYGDDTDVFANFRLLNAMTMEMILMYLLTSDYQS